MKFMLSGGIKNSYFLFIRVLVRLSDSFESFNLLYLMSVVILINGNSAISLTSMFDATVDKVVPLYTAFTKSTF